MKGSYFMELKEIYQHLNDTRGELLAVIDGLNQEQLNKQIDTDSWSIGQVCQHLIKTEELYAAAIKRGLKSQENSLPAKRSLAFLLDRSQKLVAPDIAKPTAETVEYQEIVAGLNHSRTKLFDLLNSVEDPSVLSRRHFTHPVFKDMLLIEWVQSLYLHEQRHIKQINEIKAGFK